MRVHYFAGEAELTAAQVSATVHGDADSACWDANDALLIRLADELHDTCDVSDQLWPALRATFADEAILELLMLAGYYRTVGYLANGLRMPLEPNVSRPFPAA
jgi:alkylhydroperoxidase family enzyme